MTNRLRQHCEALSLLPPFHWVSDPIDLPLTYWFTLRSLSELATKVSQPTDPLAIISFDIQRAYPSVARDAAYTKCSARLSAFQIL